MKTTGVNETKFKTTGVNEVANIAADDPEKSEPVFGVVINCELLNVRENPDKISEILTRIMHGDKIVVDIDASTNDFYSVCTETGVDGYCMKQFIEVC